MIATIVLIVTVGGVILLRPLSSRLGELLEAMAAERREPTVQKEMVRLRQKLESISERLELLEERQDFTDALLERREKPRGGELPPG